MGSEIGSAKQVVEPGDVLLCRIVPHIRRAWVVGEHEGDILRQIASTEWIVLRDDRFDPRFLRHLLLSDHFHGAFMTTVAGVGGSLNRARVSAAARIPIPLPPLPEQRRIAAILDEADALRIASVRQGETTRHLSDSAFESAVENSVLMVELGDLTELITGPFGSSVHKSDYVTGGIPLINPSHIREGQIVVDPTVAVSAGKVEALAAFALRRGDVVLGRRGEMGRAAVVGERDLPALCGTGTMVLRPRGGPDTGRFLARLLRTPRYVRMLTNAASGVTMPNLNQTAVASLRVPQVDDELLACVRAMELRLEEMYVNHACRAQTLDELFASLQHRAFRGEL